MMRRKIGVIVCAIILVPILLVLFAESSLALDLPMHFFAKETPSMGVYQQEFFSTYINKDPLLTKGYQELLNFRFKKAIAYLKKVACDKKKPKPIRSEALVYEGYAYINLGEMKKAKRALFGALKLNPKNALAYFFVANIYFLENNFQKTKANLHLALKYRPNFVAALRMLAEIYKDQHKLEEAAKYYKRITQLLPNSGYYHYKYYSILKMMKNYQEVEKVLKRMVKFQPHFLLNYIRLGENYIKMKKYDKALEQFDYVLSKNPNFSRAYEGKARVYLAMGDYRRAYKEAMQAHKIAPDNVYIKSLIADIKRAKTEKIRKIVKVVSIIVLVITVAIALVYFIISHQKKNYILRVTQYFNNSVDEIYDINTLSNFLLNFFADLGGAKRGIFLLFNRQNNQLTMKEVLGFSEKERFGFDIFSGEELTNWLSQTKKFLITLEDIEKDKYFDSVFPSLKARLKAMNLHNLMVIREKNSFVGFVALDQFQAKRRIIPYEEDLLRPLSNTSARIITNLALYETSVSDETTGLFNKRYFLQNLNAEIKRSDRYKQPVSLIIFDIDNFKHLNDTYGHPKGDEVLRHLGEIVISNFREGIDIAARTGGEEFSIILPATEEDKAVMAAERLRKAVEQYSFGETPDGAELKITISLGVATYPVHAKSPKELIKKADEALYLAKRKGKNRVCIVEHLEQPDLDISMKITSVRKKTISSSLLDETGLFSRAYFNERYSGEVRRSERSSRPCSLLLMKPDIQLSEIDRQGIFKNISQILHSNLRRGIDVPARYDKDTIAILLPETDHNQAAAIARRLKLLIDKSTPLAGNKRVTFSIGVSNYPNLGKTEESFMESAKQALKICQHLGGDRALIATPI